MHKPRRIIQVGHVGCKEEERCMQNISEKACRDDRHQLGNFGIDGRVEEITVDLKH
jgi:hypothetical protein